MLYLNSNPSKKDIKGEKAYEEFSKTLKSKALEYLTLLSQAEDPLKALVGDLSSIDNIKMNRYALLQVLASSSKEEMIDQMYKVLVKEAIMHELPLSSCNAMLAKRVKRYIKFTGQDFVNSSRRPEGELEFLMASCLLKVANLLGHYKVSQREVKYTLDKGFIPSYDIVKFSLVLPEALTKYLKKKENKEPTTFIPIGKIDYSGDYNKLKDSQDEVFSEIVGKLRSTKFKLNKGFIEKNAVNIFKTFEKVGTTEAAKLQECIQEYLDKRFHFDWKYGPDNGRLYGNGYLIPSQAGGRNWMVQFEEERHLDEVGIKHLRRKIASYGGKDPKTMPPKKGLEYLNYLDAMEKYSEGKPVGNFLGLDGKVMGPQTIALLLQDKTQYYNTVVNDGRDDMARLTGLLKEEVKGGLSPYNYGGGKDVTIGGILKFTEESRRKEVEEIVTNPKFWEIWETAFAEYFPASAKLRDFIMRLVKKTDLHHRVDFTTFAGFKATITPLQTITTKHKTVIGQREYIRKEIVHNDFGAKLVAVMGAQLDSSILSLLLLRADYAIKPVHDEYCVHPNDGDNLEKDFLEVSKLLLRYGPSHLEKVINEMFTNYVDMFGPISVKELITGDLTEGMLKVGIN